MRKGIRPSPALVISLVALFVALGGTSYAAITSLPKNSVGTAQIKNGAVTGAKIKASALKAYLKYGATLPSGDTETGVWGGGGYADNAAGGYKAFPVASFTVPLANDLDGSHVIYVSGSSATHCSGAGHADPGYLCVYESDALNSVTPTNVSIFSPLGGSTGASAGGFEIDLEATDPGDWGVSGTYAVTAP